MVTLFLAAAFAVPADAKAAAPVKLEGKWLIVYAEEGGRRNNTWEQQQATFEGNKLSYAKEGKGQTIQLTFGPHQTVKATLSGEKEGKEEKGAKEEGRAREEKPAKMYSGVCIAGQDYFCLSLEGTGADKDGKESSKERAPDAGKGPTSGSFILILRRQRTGGKE